MAEIDCATECDYYCSIKDFRININLLHRGGGGMIASVRLLAKKIAAVSVVAIFSFVSNAVAATIYVNADLGNDEATGASMATAVKTLSTAIGKAVSGDTVFLAPGIYAGDANRNLNWGNKNLNLIGSGSAEQTIIDLENSGCFLNLFSTSVTSTNSKLQNLTIRNGSSANGGGLYLTGAGLTVEDCIFSYNVSSSNGGGAACLQNSSSKFTNCRFIMNVKTGAMVGGPSGGGALSINRGNLEIVNCNFTGNTADRGAALFITGIATKVTIDSSVFDANTAANSAVIGVDNIYGSNIELNISNSLICNNTTTSNDSILAVNLSSMTTSIRNCTIYNNTVKSGSHITCSGTFKMYNTVFLGTFSGTPTEVLYSCLAPSRTGTGNISPDPQLGVRGYPVADSPCINAGSSLYAPAADLTGIARPQGATPDIGCYEYLDSNGNGLPDYFEIMAGLDPAQSNSADLDSDNDGLTNQQEYELGTDPGNMDSDGDTVADGTEVSLGYDPLTYTRIIHVDASRPDDSGSGSATSPKKSIGAAIALTRYGDDNVIIVTPGIYLGANNRNLNFNGKDTKLIGANGPSTTLVDMENLGSFLTLNNGETLKSRVEGFTFTRGVSSITGTSPSIVRSGASVIDLDNAGLEISNCRFIDNTAGAYDGDSTKLLNMKGSGTSAAVICARSKPVIISGCLFRNNRSYSIADQLSAGAVGINTPGATNLIENCSFINNAAYGNGVICNAAGGLEIRKCRFIGNFTGNGNGAIKFGRNCPVLLENCIFAKNNTLEKYSDLYFETNNSNPITIRNITVAHGKSSNGTSCYLGSPATINNSIVQGTIELWSAGLAVTANNNCTETSLAGYGGSNLSVDPEVLPNGYLSADSPCINAGRLTGAPSTDIDGVPRPQGGAVDIGAQEYIDSDSDEIPDPIEIAAGLNPNNAADAPSDKDNDGIKNLDEYLLGLDLNNPDTDGDGMGDKYELDHGFAPLLPTRIIYAYSLRPNDNGDGLSAATAKKSIQAAWALAKQPGENIIKLLPGTFSEPLEATLQMDGCDIKIIGENGPDETIIDMADSKRGLLKIDTGPGLNPLLEGVTLTGANCTNLVTVGNSSSFTIRNCKISNNIQGVDIGGPSGMLMITSGTVNLEKVELSNNTTPNGGNGVLIYSEGDVNMNRCLLTGNETGGPLLSLCGSNSIVNTIMNRNNLRRGNLISLAEPFLNSSSTAAMLTLTNSTLHENTNNVSSTIHLNKDCSINILNSILTGKLTGDAISVNYSRVDSEYAGLGSHNITADPGVALSGFLVADSPCIDAGSNDGAPVDDFTGNLRPFNAVVDIGAEEYADANNNGISDSYENLYGHAIDPNGDDDGDGLTNLYEYLHGLDIANPDSDGDGMPDGWENENNLNPLVNDALEDPDNDELLNIDEYRAGTDPHSADTDNDGKNDYWEYRVAFSNPVVADYAGTETVAATINGNAGTFPSGSWENEGTAVLLRDRAGWIQYNIDIQSGATYIIELEITKTSDQYYRADMGISCYVDDGLSATNNFTLINNQITKTRFFSPKMMPGEHSLKFVIHNISRGPLLKILSVKLIAVPGVSDAANWAEHRLTNMTQVTIPPVSKVSPVCIEGANSCFIEKAHVDGYYKEPNDSSPDPSFRNLPHDGWYVDLPLNPSGAGNKLQFTFQNGVESVAGTTQWIPTDVITQGKITIRKNDSLRLAVNTPDDYTGNVNLTVGDQSITLEKDQIQCWKFDTAGNYMVVAEWTPAIGAPERHYMIVEVLEGTFSSHPFIVYVTETREIANPGISPEAILDCDYFIWFSDKQTHSGKRLFTVASKGLQRTGYLACRLYPGGPVLDATGIQTFRAVSHQSEGYHQAGSVSEDGTQEYFGYIAPSCFTQDMTIKVVLWGTNSLFLDGTRIKYFTISDLNASGEIAYTIKGTPGFTTCQSIYVYQNGVFVRDIQ